MKTVVVAFMLALELSLTGVMAIDIYSVGHINNYVQINNIIIIVQPLGSHGT